MWKVKGKGWKVEGCGRMGKVIAKAWQVEGERRR